jgi:hypothetical protein
LNLVGTFKVVEIKKKTSAVFFKELKVGDVFSLQYGLNGRYESAPSIDIFRDGKYVHHNNAVQLTNNLSRFTLEQIG